METAYNLSDSIFIKSSIDRNIYEMNMNTVNKTLQHTIDRKISTERMLYFVIVCLVLMTIGIGLLLLRIRKSKRDLSTANRLHAKAISSMKDADQQKETEMESLSRELVGKTMKMEHLEKIISEIETIVGKRGAITTEKAQLLRNLLKPIALEEQTWQSFSYHFENVDKNFSIELQRRHPDLTLGEKRLISYIMMNLTSKEIAELTNKSVRSVDSARYRLSKKLDLENGTTLFNYLSSIANKFHTPANPINHATENPDIGDSTQISHQDNQDDACFDKKG